MMIFNTSFTTYFEKQVWVITKYTKATKAEGNKFYLIAVPSLLE